MRDLFPAYYAPSEADLATLWEKATFVFDSNVLLQLYRLPDKAQEQALSILTHLKGRVWIPHQVALEYHRGRVRSIIEARDVVENHVEPIRRAFAEVERALGVIKFEERGLQGAVKEVAKIRASADVVIKAAEGALTGHIDPTGVDPVADQLAEIFAGAIGPAPSSQAEIKAVEEAGKTRYSLKMGPGFKDADKASYRFGDLTYQGEFADYLLWCQTLEHIRTSGLRDLIFVTRDAKTDWWLEHNKKVWGPLPEMYSEMLREGSLERFWMYSFDNFLEVAGRSLQLAVSPTTLTDVAQSSIQQSEDELVDAQWANLHPSKTKRVRNRATALMNLLRAEGYEPLAGAHSTALGVRKGEDGAMAAIAAYSDYMQLEGASILIKQALKRLLEDFSVERVDIFIYDDAAILTENAVVSLIINVAPVLVELSYRGRTHLHWVSPNLAKGRVSWQLS